MWQTMFLCRFLKNQKINNRVNNCVFLFELQILSLLFGVYISEHCFDLELGHDWTIGIIWSQIGKLWIFATNPGYMPGRFVETQKLLCGKNFQKTVWHNFDGPVMTQ